MGIQEAIQMVNEGSGVEFIRNRIKGNFEALLNRPVTILDIVISDSKYYEGKKFATFIIEGDDAHYYTTNSDVAVAQLRLLQEGLDEDGLDWDALTVTFEPVLSKQRRRYYAVRAELKPGVKEKLDKRAAQEEEERRIAL